jgi:hypothetical protein
MAPKKMLVLLAALAVLAVTALTQIASASHVRPKGATPLRASLVPAFKSCTAPNRTHGAPLAFPSCNPPVQESNFLTVGTPDANGAPAKSSGFLLLKVDAVPPADLLFTLTITDVRCLPGTNASVCNSPNAAGGPDYSGQLQSDATIRISDHYNGPNLNEAATMVDIPNPISATCVNTADTTVGGTCTVTGNSCNPPPECAIRDDERMVIELGQVFVRDGGADGQVATADNTVFMRQGIFIP